MTEAVDLTLRREKDLIGWCVGFKAQMIRLAMSLPQSVNLVRVAEVEVEAKLGAAVISFGEDG